jgi:predicted ABC-type ATPase
LKIVFLRLASVQIATRRIAERVKQDGHNVPTGDVLRRFERGGENFCSFYRSLADSWAVYDNSAERPLLIEKSL